MTPSLILIQASTRRVDGQIRRGLLAGLILFWALVLGLIFN